MCYDLITGKMSELFMTILTSKLQLYKVNEAYVNDPDSIQVSESDKNPMIGFLSYKSYFEHVLLYCLNSYQRLKPIMVIVCFILQQRRTIWFLQKLFSGEQSAACFALTDKPRPTSKCFLRFEKIQVNLTNKNGQNALYYAQKNQSKEMITLLLANGAKQRTPSNKYIKSNSFSRQEWSMF